MEVKRQEIKEVIIHQLLPTNLEQFIDTIQAGPVLWVNGIILRKTTLPEIDDLIREQMGGIIRWNTCEFSKMDDYSPTIQIPFSGSIPLIDVSHNAIFMQVSKWLKEQPEYQTIK